MTDPGRIVVLNGAPRSGKSTIVEVIQETFEGVWMNLGVDVLCRHATPARYQPGIGLRPGGEQPDIEAVIPALYAAMYDSIAAHSRQSLNVVVDVDHHDSYSRPLGILPDAARRLDGLPVRLVGVRCPLEVVMQRREATWGSRPLEHAALWQEEVHRPGVYDMELDTSAMSASSCAGLIWLRLQDGAPPTAFHRLATTSWTT